MRIGWVLLSATACDGDYDVRGETDDGKFWLQRRSAGIARGFLVTLER
jgi:hypothetical protein